MTVIETCREPDIPPLSVTVAVIMWVPAVSVRENDAPVPICPTRFDVQRRPGRHVAILIVGRAAREGDRRPLGIRRVVQRVTHDTSVRYWRVVDEAVLPAPMFE